MNWVQVRHRLPDTEKDVLVTDGKNICISWWRTYQWEHAHCDYSCPRKGDVSAWMDLPEVPK